VRLSHNSSGSSRSFGLRSLPNAVKVTFVLH
jgi:hypothetical protein